MIEDKLAKDATTRLRKVGGQLRGIERMVNERRYCVDVLNQIAAVQAALGSVGKILLRNHIDTCVASAFTDGSKRERKQKIDELVKVYGRFCRIA